MFQLFFKQSIYKSICAFVWQKQKKNIVSSLKYLFLMEYFDELGSAKSFEIEMNWKWR